MKHTEEEFTCTALRAGGCDYHFEGRCEDCDVRRLSRLSLEQVTDQFSDGRVTRNQFDAYRWTWAALSPYGNNAHWRHQPYVIDSDVRRIARKLCRIRDLEIPEEMKET